jgi:hypothetical protein
VTIYTYILKSNVSIGNSFYLLKHLGWWVLIFLTVLSVGTIVIYGRVGRETSLSPANIRKELI